MDVKRLTEITKFKKVFDKFESMKNVKIEYIIFTEQILNRK